MLEELREEVYKAHMSLWSEKLVVWTSGNVSARDGRTNLIVIKPSGLHYNELSPENMVVVNMEGEVIEGNLKPSVDTMTHLYIYSHMEKINSVIHTHSTYATALAAAGQSLPVCLTAMADFFGSDVPLGNLKVIGGSEIGKEIVEKIGKSKAILMQNHGVFTVGSTIEEALKAAIYVEESAKVFILSKIVGEAKRIPQPMIEELHRNYTSNYGQNRGKEGEKWQKLT